MDPTFKIIPQKTKRFTCIVDNDRVVQTVHEPYSITFVKSTLFTLKMVEFRHIVKRQYMLGSVHCYQLDIPPSFTQDTESVILILRFNYIESLH